MIIQFIYIISICQTDLLSYRHIGHGAGIQKVPCLQGIQIIFDLNRGRLFRSLGQPKLQLIHTAVLAVVKAININMDPLPGQGLIPIVIFQYGGNGGAVGGDKPAIRMIQVGGIGNCHNSLLAHRLIGINPMKGTGSIFAMIGSWLTSSPVIVVEGYIRPNSLAHSSGIKGQIGVIRQTGGGIPLLVYVDIHVVVDSDDPSIADPGAGSLMLLNIIVDRLVLVVIGRNQGDGIIQVITLGPDKSSGYLADIRFFPILGSTGPVIPGRRLDPLSADGALVGILAGGIVIPYCHRRIRIQVQDIGIRPADGLVVPGSTVIDILQIPHQLPIGALGIGGIIFGLQGSRPGDLRICGCNRLQGFLGCLQGCHAGQGSHRLLLAGIGSCSLINPLGRLSGRHKIRPAGHRIIIPIQIMGLRQQGPCRFLPLYAINRPGRLCGLMEEVEVAGTAVTRRVAVPLTVINQRIGWACAIKTRFNLNPGIPHNLHRIKGIINGVSCHNLSTSRIEVGSILVLQIIIVSICLQGEFRFSQGRLDLTVGNGNRGTPPGLGQGIGISAVGADDQVLVSCHDSPGSIGHQGIVGLSAAAGLGHLAIFRLCTGVAGVLLLAAWISPILAIRIHRGCLQAAVTAYNRIFISLLRICGGIPISVPLHSSQQLPIALLCRVCQSIDRQKGKEHAYRQQERPDSSLFHILHSSFLNIAAALDRVTFLALAPIVTFLLSLISFLFLSFISPAGKSDR